VGDRRLTPPRAVLFDLDGTLVDSAPDIARAVNAGFAPLGVPPFTIADVIGMIGGGASVAVKRAAEKAGLALGPTEEAAVLARFLETYEAVSAEGRGLFDGARDLLSALSADGIGLGLVTNKAERITDVAIRALGIAHHFGVVHGASDRLAKKPDPAMLLAALDSLGVAPHEAVMVGDGPADARAGQAAGCRVVLVDFGYTSIPVHDLGADAVISHLSQLRGLWRS
jgi:phosphoglycolate phosphatase